MVLVEKLGMLVEEFEKKISFILSIPHEQVKIISVQGVLSEHAKSTNLRESSILGYSNYRLFTKDDGLLLTFLNIKSHIDNMSANIAMFNYKMP